jgi:hypothetical protein
MASSSLRSQQPSIHSYFQKVPKSQYEAAMAVQATVDPGLPSSIQT